MSALADALLNISGDPIGTAMDIGILYYLRGIKSNLVAEISRVRERTERLENNHIGGSGG